MCRGQPRLELCDDDPSAYTIGILGDLHLDPRDLEDSLVARRHMQRTLSEKPNRFLVSLGDLGQSSKCDATLMHGSTWKAVGNEDSDQLFAGTSQCFKLAREYLDGLGPRNLKYSNESKGYLSLVGERKERP